MVDVSIQIAKEKNCYNCKKKMPWTTLSCEKYPDGKPKEVRKEGKCSEFVYRSTVR